MLYPREWEKGEGESLCMLNIVHVNSVEEEKRLRTIPDFELILTLRNHLRVHSLLLETPKARCVWSQNYCILERQEVHYVTPYGQTH